jgi:hypothetical protein
MAYGIFLEMGLPSLYVKEITVLLYFNYSIKTGKKPFDDDKN